MYQSIYSYISKRYRRSFLSSLVMAVAILVGFVDYSANSADGDQAGVSIIKSAHADTPHTDDGGGPGGTGAGCGPGGASCGGSDSGW